jgi:hypothetical protein
VKKCTKFSEQGNASLSLQSSTRNRFKSFPIEADEHLCAVLRYVERNAPAGQPGQAGGTVALVEPVAAPARRRRGQGHHGAMADPEPGDWDRPMKAAAWFAPGRRYVG